MKNSIAFISEHASPLALLGSTDCGGQNVYVAELCKALAAKGYCIDIFTRKENKQQDEIINWLPNVRVIHIIAGPEKVFPKEDLFQHIPRFLDNMIDFIQTESVSYQLIHANFFMSAMVASEIKKLLGIPYVITFHALGLIRKIYQKEMDKFPEGRCAIEKFLVQDADGIIAECPQDEEDLINHYNARIDKIKVIPCGFNPLEFFPINKEVARKKIGADKNEFIVLQLGRIVPRKGIDNVIKAVGLLKDKIKNIRLIIVGGDADFPDLLKTPEIIRLLSIAKAQNLTTQITFAGRKSREELKFYYSAADVFTTTPWYEPFGITPLEAMGCGLPVIGSSVGGIKHTVLDNETGFLVAPNNEVELAGKIEFLYNNKKRSIVISKNAVSRVNKYFTWKSIAVSIANFYNVVLDKKEVKKTPAKIVYINEIIKSKANLKQAF